MKDQINERFDAIQKILLAEQKKSAKIMSGHFFNFPLPGLINCAFAGSRENLSFMMNNILRAGP
jgi:hypothetical protein